MLSRKSRKSAGRNQAPARIQPSRRGHRRPDLKLFAEQLEDRVLLATDIWTGLSPAIRQRQLDRCEQLAAHGSPGVPQR